MSEQEGRQDINDNDSGSGAAALPSQVTYVKTLNLFDCVMAYSKLLFYLNPTKLM